MHQQVQQLVTVVEAALAIDHLQAVGVAVQGNAVIRLRRMHSRNQGLRMGGADVVVDIHTVGRATDGAHLRAEFAQHGGGDLVGRAVGCIHHQLQAFERQISREHALAKFNIAPGSVVESPGFAQVRGVHPGRRLLQHGFHIALPGVGQLAAVGAEELDAVIGKRVVAGADHHAQCGTLRPRQKRHARRGQGAEQHHINTGGIEAALHGAFQHVAADARVFANQNGGSLFAALEHAAHRMGQAQDKVRRNRCNTHGAANAVGSKVLSAHSLFIPSRFACPGPAWRPILPALAW